jgi:hypothetical protein
MALQSGRKVKEPGRRIEGIPNIGDLALERGGNRCSWFILFAEGDYSFSPLEVKHLNKKISTGRRLRF